MSGHWMKTSFGVALTLIATSWLSCGLDHKLVAIEIQPAAGFNFATPDPAAQGVFTAIGTYVHPPGTADITSKVTWKTDVPQLLVVTGGVVSPQPGMSVELPTCTPISIAAEISYEFRYCHGERSDEGGLPRREHHASKCDSESYTLGWGYDNERAGWNCMQCCWWNLRCSL